MNQPVIVDVARTPFGRRGGPLGDYHPTELLGCAQRGVLERTGVDPALIEQVVGGCVTQAGEQSSNVTRTAWLHAGLPQQTGATTVDCQCGSSQQALQLVGALIAAGVIRAGIACGVEAMTRIPLMSNFPGPTGRPRPASWSIDLPNQYVAADRIATNRGISRAELDDWGLRSHRLATAAWDQGRYDPQIIAVPLPPDADGVDRGTMTRDNGMRESSPEAMAALAPINDDGLHTAGTASQITDGASVALLMAADLAAELGLRPRARIRAQALVGGDPYYHLDGPVQAAEKVLAAAGMTVGDVDLFEVNEAFAAVPMSFHRTVGADPDLVNVNGGSIAVGHPVGATGIRLVGNALYELERRDAQTAFVSMCAGGALATGAVIERL